MVWCWASHLRFGCLNLWRLWCDAVVCCGADTIRRRLSDRKSIASCLLGAGLIAGGAGDAPAQSAPLALPFTIGTFAGGATKVCNTTNYGDGCLAAQGSLSTDLRAVTTDRYGNIYIADTNNSRIRRVDHLTGIITSWAGAGTVCAATQDAYGDGCPVANSANFNKPRGVAADARGNIFISGYADQLIHRVDAASGVMTRVAGTVSAGSTGSGQSGFTGDGGPATSAMLNSPRGANADLSGNVYIADTGNYRIRVVYANGAVPGLSSPVAGNIYTIAGTGTNATSGDNGPATAAPVSNPSDVLADATGNIFVADGSGRVRVIFASGSRVAALIKSASGQAAVVGNIYTIAGGGSSTYSKPVLATSISLGAQKLAFDPAGNLYIADSGSKAYFVDVNTGYIQLIAGGATTVCTQASDTLGDGCPATQATISSGGNGIGVAVDPRGNLYVTDSADLRVRVVSNGLQFAAASAGASTVQGLRFHFGAGDAPAATNPLQLRGASDFSTIAGVSCTANGDTTEDCNATVSFSPGPAGARAAAVSVASAQGAIAHLALSGFSNAAGMTISPAAATSMGTGLKPGGVAVDSAGAVYIADQAAARVVVFPPGSSVSTALITGLTTPSAVAVGPDGKVYVADPGSNSVRSLASGSSTSQTIGTGLVAPQGVAVDSKGDLFIADTGNKRVLVVSADGAQQTPVGSGFVSPTQVAVDSSDNLYIVDSSNKSLLMLTPAGVQTVMSLNGASASAVAVDPAGDVLVASTQTKGISVFPAGGATSFDLGVTVNSPAQLALDGAGNLFVADASAATVTELQRASGAVTLASPAVTMTVTALSSGNQSLALATPFVSLGASQDFTLIAAPSNGCVAGGSLTSGAICGLVAQFTPTASGSIAAISALAANQSNGSVSIQLEGSSTATASTVTNLSAPVPANPTEGQTVQLTASSSSQGVPVTVGSVAFVVDGTEMTPIAIAAGSVTPSFAGLKQGTHTIGAIFLSTGPYLSSRAAQSFSIGANVGPAYLAVTGGSGQSATVATGFATPLQVLVTNGSHQPLAGVSVTFTVPSTGASATLGGNSSATVATDNTGVATSPLPQANKIAGAYLVTAAAANLSQTVTLALTNLAASPATIAATSGSAQTVMIGSLALLAPIQATVMDSYGNGVAGAVVTFSAPAAGASGAFLAGSGSASVATNAAGLATAPPFQANGTGGSYTISGTLGSLPVVSFALTNLAGDTRVVTEPQFPPVCTTLQANKVSVAGTLLASDETNYDTSAIQTAINNCPAGQGVRLQTNGTNSAFLIGPITIKGGVTLWVDAAVTVYASRNPRDYDTTAGACGVVNASNTGCTNIITVTQANAAIMGFGVFDGRGGAKLLLNGVAGPSSWWDLSSQAQTQSLEQNNPDFLTINANNFTLYKITFRNAPIGHINFKGNGFTAWGVKLITPGDARNTDGMDLGPALNVTVRQSWVTDGDDNIVLKPGSSSNNPACANYSILNNHFGTGHGMSIGSQTNGGAANLYVNNLWEDGNPVIDGSGTGIRLASDSSRGGYVHDVSWNNVCQQNVKYPIQFDGYFSSNTGKLYPYYSNVSLHNIHSLTEGAITLGGYSAAFPLAIDLDNVQVDGAVASDVSPAPQYSAVTLGPGPVSFASLIAGNGVTVANDIVNSAAPLSCPATVFQRIAPELFTSTPTIATTQPLTVTAMLEPFGPISQAQVAAGIPSPTGSVQVLENGVLLGTSAIPVGGLLTPVVLTGLTPGQHTLSLAYSGDLNYSSLGPASISMPTLVVQVTGSATAPVSLQPSASSLAQGQTLTLAISVTGTPTPTGSVTVMDGVVPLGSVSVNAGGNATFTTSTLAVGSHSLSVLYSGDVVYAQSSSVTATVSITGTATAAVSLSAPTSLLPNQNLSVQATVTGSSGTPTGSVLLTDAGTRYGPVVLAGGTATLSEPSPAVGTHALIVTYSGDATYAPSQAQASVTVAKASTTLSVMPAASAISSSQSISVAISTTTASGATAATGTVVLTSGNFSATLTLAAGSATFTVAGGSLALGTDQLTATYSGDAVYGAAVASASVTVTASTFTVAAVPLPALAINSSVTSTVTVSSNNAYSGMIGVSCAVANSAGANVSLPSCSLSVSTLQLSTSTPSLQTTLTLSSIQKAGLERGPLHRGSFPTGFAALITFGCILGRSRRRARSLLGCWLCLAVATAVIGCGGNNASSPAPLAAGAYTVTVTAVDSVTGTNQAATLTVNVL
jgi:sugar lactone lactonase YvrE